MDTQVSELYGEPQTIHYLIVSIDDIREVTETIKFMLAQHCQKDDIRIVMKSIPIMAIPLPQSLSSFILGLGVPSKILKRTVPGTSKIRVIKNLNECDGSSVSDFLAQDPGEPMIKVIDDYSLIEFEPRCLDDLAYAANNVIKLLKSSAERFAFVNLKRRLRLKVIPSDNGHPGFKLIVRVPQVLQTS